MVFESRDTTKLPREQVVILGAKQIRDYLREKCVKGPGGTPERRFWDKDIDTTLAQQHWQDVMKRQRKSLPWIVISTGKTGYEGPLPGTVEEVMTLLKKYGG